MIDEEDKNKRAAKAAEKAFISYRIYDSFCFNARARDISEIEEWERITDVDFVTFGYGKTTAIFHEVKAQVQQYSSDSNYFNICVELIGNFGKYRCDDKHTTQAGKKDCNTCSSHDSCDGWGTWVKDKITQETIWKGHEKETAKSPDELQNYLDLKGQGDNYLKEYYIKYGAGWLYKNPLVQADIYHIWLPFVFENSISNVVAYETPENIERWRKNPRLTEESKLVTRVPFDFFVSITRDELLGFIKDLDKRPMNDGLGYYLPVKKILDDYYYKEEGARSHDIAITPIIEYVDKDGKAHTEKAQGSYMISASLSQKARIKEQTRPLSEGEECSLIVNGIENGALTDASITTISNHPNYYNRYHKMGNETPTEVLIEALVFRCNLKIVSDDKLHIEI